MHTTKMQPTSNEIAGSLMLLNITKCWTVKCKPKSQIKYLIFKQILVNIYANKITRFDVNKTGLSFRLAKLAAN